MTEQGTPDRTVKDQPADGCFPAEQYLKTQHSNRWRGETPLPVGAGMRTVLF